MTKFSGLERVGLIIMFHEFVISDDFLNISITVHHFHHLLDFCVLSVGCLDLFVSWRFGFLASWLWRGAALESPNLFFSVQNKTRKGEPSISRDSRQHHPIPALQEKRQAEIMMKHKDWRCPGIGIAAVASLVGHADGLVAASGRQQGTHAFGQRWASTHLQARATSHSVACER